MLINHGCRLCLLSMVISHAACLLTMVSYKPCLQTMTMVINHWLRMDYHNQQAQQQRPQPPSNTIETTISRSNQFLGAAKVEGCLVFVSMVRHQQGLRLYTSKAPPSTAKLWQGSGNDDLTTKNIVSDGDTKLVRLWSSHGKRWLVNDG